MHSFRKKILAKRVASDISMNPHIDRKKLEDALEEVNAMEEVFGVPNPTDILLDCMVDACAFSMICQAFRFKYNLGSVEKIRMDAFQMALPRVEDYQNVNGRYQ